METGETGFRDNTQSHRFEMPAGDELAIIEYSKTGNIYNLNHTEVPEQLEGKGIAGKLVLETFRFLDEGGFKMRPRCAYVAMYVRRHPEWQRLVAAD